MIPAFTNEGAAERPHPRLGWRPDKPDRRDYRLAPPPPGRVLPPSADLRPEMPGVYDQGQLGSCTANAIAGAIEYNLRLARMPEFVPSRLLIYAMERIVEGTLAVDAGAEIHDGIRAVATQGVCAETDWPYNVRRFRERPSSQILEIAARNLVTAYARVDQTLASMRGVLADGFPFVFGFSCYQTFESREVERTGVLHVPATSEKMIGGHAVLAVGYDDAARTFMIRNSYGSRWGQAGYFTMPYEYLLDQNLVDDMWVITSLASHAKVAHTALGSEVVLVPHPPIDVMSDQR